MKIRIKLFFAIIVAFIPIPYFRNFAYRLFAGYKIGQNVHIRYGTVIVGEDCVIENNVVFQGFLLILSNNIYIKKNAKIYRFVQIHHLRNFEIGENSIIGVSCVFKARQNEVSDKYHLSEFVLGNNSVINQKCYFELTDNVSIGSNVVFGGGEIKLYTHGYDIYKNKNIGAINIQDNCYLGANVLICPGVFICKEVIITPCTVVFKNIEEKGIYSSHSLRKLSDNPTFSKDNKVLLESNTEKIWRKK